MSRGRLVRLAVAAALLCGGFYWIHGTSIEPGRVSLYVTAIIGAITAVYALFTYEILLQNQAMAQAAVDATKLTERGLRFSYTQNLVYRTLNTKDPLFRSTPGITPIDNEDYRRAIADQDDEQRQQTEFVFAVVKNVGRGAATSLSIEAQYDITDSSNVNKEYSVAKKASVQILEPNMGAALCIFFSRVPTRDDRVVLVSATITTSNFYRDALKEPLEETRIGPTNHHVDSEAACLVRLS
jgi:hypothetical protein